MNDAPAIEFSTDDAGRWRRYQNTPWHDLLRGRLSGSLDHTAVIAPTNLPVPIKRTVNDVVARTRLWPNERQDVARELCAHFADGLESGRSPEQLIAEFGDPSPAAKLIRRAKVRCRSWSWHVWHRGWQTLLCLSLLVVTVWTVLTIRFALATPTITFDLVAEHDDASRAIPKEVRAWPFYRRGLVQIDRRDILNTYEFDSSNSTEREFKPRDVMESGPADPNWEKVREYLLRMDATIQLFVEAAQHEQLGFINRDPENDAWLKWHGSDGWETYNANTTGPTILLAQTHDLWTVRSFLIGALHIAIEDGDGPRAVQVSDALLRLTDHIRQTFDGMITDLCAFATLRPTLKQLRSLIIEHGELLTDADLDRLERRISVTLGSGGITYRFEGDERMWQDYIQRAYTDDGNGNGRMTPEGLDILRDFSFDHPALMVIEGFGAGNAVDTMKDWRTLVSGAAVTLLVADRREMQRKFEEMFRLQREAWTDLETPIVDSRYVAEVRRITKEEPVKYLPIAAVGGVNGWWQSAKLSRSLVAVNTERDAALTAIALERFRRETGDWPTSLDEMVPHFVSEPPTDPYAASEPLMYRVVDGRPEVWSVGPNHTPDGFTAPPADTPGWMSDSGDWRLLPPEETLY